jgi:hypothetical protein
VRLVVLGLARREEEDLRVDPFERIRERLFVVDVDDDLQPERGRALVQLLEVLLLVVLLDDNQAGVGAGVPGRLGRGVDAEENRQGGRLAHPGGGRAHSEPLGPLRLGRPRGVRIGDDRDDRDPVALGDRLAEASRPCHCVVMLMQPARCRAGRPQLEQRGSAFLEHDLAVDRQLVDHAHHNGSDRGRGHPDHLPCGVPLVDDQDRLSSP